MTNTLKNKIVTLCIALIILTTCASLISSWWSTSRYSEQNLAKDIDVAQNVYRQYLNAQESLLLTAAKVLTADFGFKQAVATQDADTIGSVLYNHSQRINADVMLLIDLSGKLVSANTEQSFQDESLAPIITALQANLEQSSFVIMAGDMYQVILLPVKAPRTIAYSLVGFKITNEVALELKSLTGMDISFFASHDNFAVSSLFNQTEQAYLLEYLNSSTELRLLSAKPVYRNQKIPLPSIATHPIFVLLSADLTNSYTEYENLFFTILTLAGVTLLIAVIASNVLAKNLTVPLYQLTELAQQFAKGNYQAKFSGSKASSEIKTLMRAFNNMGKDIQQREQQISFQAHHDSLTGLYNRAALLDVLAEQLAANTQYTLACIDIRGLRHINDKLGPRIGDECLKAVADRIAEFSAPFDSINARIGGDEFLTVFPTDAVYAEKSGIIGLMAQLQAGYVIQGLNIKLSFNAGVVNYPEQGSKADDLVRRVLIAVDNAAKNSNSIHYYQTGEDEAHLERLAIIDELKQAIIDDNGQLFMTYQPKLNLQSKQVDKVESLIRWQNKQGQWVSPELFIDLAEQSGLIVDLTAWVVKTVVAQVSEWRALNLQMQAAINVSAQDIVHPNFHTYLFKVLNDYQVPAELITIELTERDMIENADAGIQALENLKAIGVKISLDDYGVGQTSLNRLKVLPIDELKLDKCFILKLDESAEDQYIAQSTITLGHQLGVKVVAEGVENQASLTLLEGMQCDYAQGYYLSKPLRAEQFVDWLEEFYEAP